MLLSTVLMLRPLADVLLPMTLGPRWLESVSDWMPFRWVTDAVRTSFSGEFARDPMLYGTAWAAALFVLSLWWGTATFRKENA